MSNQTVEPFESDEIDEYIKYNREYRFMNMNTKGSLLGKLLRESIQWQLNDILNDILGLNCFWLQLDVPLS